MLFEEELTEYLYSQNKEISQQLKKIKNFKYRDEYFKIRKYLDDFIENKSKDRFIIIPGLRGLGKTTILFQLYEYLLNEKKLDESNLLYLSMDQITSYFDTNLLNIVDNFLKNTHNTDKAHLDEKVFIFLDECHYDKKWAISGKIIYDTTENIFLVFTGSSAIDLEINADIARRAEKEQIFPNNFKDYLSLKHNISINPDFSKNLKNIIYFGQDEYIHKGEILENKIAKTLFSLNNNVKFEFESFLRAYGFPFTLEYDENKSYEKIFTNVERVIEKDIPSIKSFNTSTTDTIRRILFYIALQKPGGTSNQKIANYLSISPNSVREILDTLEKTQMIFSVKPYGGSAKILKKPWQYYFLSPSLKTAINFEIRRFNLNNNKCFGALAENLVGTSLYKMIKTDFKTMGLFYSSLKGGSNFIVRTKLDDIVPIEVGIGKKTKSQLKKDMAQYNSDYGILVSNRYDRIKKTNDIIHIPLIDFGFI